MPPKTITCCICGKEISKRKSLQFRDGRACRDHQEVIEVVEKNKKELEDIETIRKVNETMQVLALTCQVRLLIHCGGPAAFLLQRVESVFGSSVATKVRHEVKQRGPLTDEEIERSLLTYMHARQMATGECIVERDLAKGMEKIVEP